MDLYLVHGPWAVKNGDVEGVWNDMVKVKESGLSRYVCPKRIACGSHFLHFLVERRDTSPPFIRSIGVSNFTLDWLQRVVKTGKIPAVNQVP